jgi:hypothetical protein
MELPCSLTATAVRPSLSKSGVCLTSQVSINVLLAHQISTHCYSSLAIMSLKLWFVLYCNVKVVGASSITFARIQHQSKKCALLISSPLRRILQTQSCLFTFMNSTSDHVWSCLMRIARCLIRWCNWSLRHEGVRHFPWLAGHTGHCGNVIVIGCLAVAVTTPWCWPPPDSSHIYKQIIPPIIIALPKYGLISLKAAS